MRDRIGELDAGVALLNSNTKKREDILTQLSKVTLEKLSDTEDRKHLSVLLRDDTTTLLSHEMNDALKWFSLRVKDLVSTPFQRH